MLARIDSYKISTVYRPDALLIPHPEEDAVISATVLHQKLQEPKKKGRKRKDSSEDSDSDEAKTIKHEKSACPLLMEYMMNSTIHGVRYFVEGSRHWIERTWWILAFTLCVCLCCWSIFEVYKKFGTDPIIISIDSKLKPVTEIAFPAVTICPEAKYRGDTGFNLTTVNRLYKRDKRHPHGFMSDDNTQLLIQKALTRVCHHSIAARNKTDKSTDYVIKYIKKVALRLDDVIEKCKWQNVPYNCSDLFMNVLTDEGMCFTFNGINSTDLFNDKITPDLPSFFRKPKIRRLYPDADSAHEELTHFTASNAGLFGGLEVTLKLQKKDTDYLCRKGVTGFRIVLHPGIEMPQPSKHFFHVPLQQHVSVAVKPNIITTKSNVLHKYDEEAMRCIVDRETPPKLKFFRNYTQRNCELDCLSTFTTKLDMDFYFSVPRKAKTNVTKIQDLHNAEKMVDLFYHRNYPRNYCKCFPGCESITYDTEISYANLNLAKYHAAASGEPVDESEFYDAKLSKVSIFFKEEEFHVSKRSELYSGFELVGTIGGLLGLYMGISVLSVLELIYYFSLRLFCISRMQKIAEKRQLQQQLQQLQQQQVVVGPYAPVAKID